MANENFTLALAPGNFTEPKSYKVTSFDNIMESVATSLYTYYTPILIIFGLIGNFISIFVFFNSKLRLQSTSYYLTALALSDIVFLIQLLPPWLNAMKIHNIFLRDYFCQIIVFSSYSTCFLSAWLVVAFTIERFVAVVYPLQRSSMCTMARAKFIIAFLVITALGLNIPMFKYTSPSTNDCNIDNDYLNQAERFNILDTVVSFTVPLAVIFILNTWIVVGVYRLERARHELVPVESQADTGCVPPPPLLPRSQRRVTRMLLLVSTVYIVLNVPAYTMRILVYMYEMKSEEYNGRWAALQQLALTFFNTNFGINFFLYCLSGQNFRRALCQAIPRLRRRYRRRTNIMRMTTRRVPRPSSASTSFASATDASSMYVTMHLSERASCSVRRHRSEPVIARWTFDNSRAQRTLELPASNNEMLSSPAAIDTNSATSPLPETNLQLEVPEFRKIPFVLFPYRNLIVPRTKRSSSVDTSSKRCSVGGGE